MNFFSPAQLVGYVAFVLGVSAFLQKSDRRLIFFNACQCTVYTVHFFLLGNLPASGSTFVSAIRSTLALKFHARWMAALFIGINLALGAVIVRHLTGWLPVVGSCLGTYGLFMMRGIRLRLAMLCSTVLWIANNILSGSIGGTALESTIFLANGTTILRMLFYARAQKRLLKEKS